MAKYEITLKNDVDDANTDIINTSNGYLAAIEYALDSHYDEEERVFEIICKRIED